MKVQWKKWPEEKPEENFGYYWIADRSSPPLVTVGVFCFSDWRDIGNNFLNESITHWAEIEYPEPPEK